MLRRPQHAGRVVQIAVGLDVDRRSACGSSRRAPRPPRPARRSPCRRRPVRRDSCTACCDPRAARCARPRNCSAREDPVFIHDQRPQFGVDAGRADRARVPAGALLLERARAAPRCALSDSRPRVSRRAPGSRAACPAIICLRHFVDDAPAGWLRRRRRPCVGGPAAAAASATAAAATWPHDAWRDAAEADVGRVAAEQRGERRADQRRRCRRLLRGRACSRRTCSRRDRTADDAAGSSSVPESRPWTSSADELRELAPRAARLQASAVVRPRSADSAHRAAPWRSRAPDRNRRRRSSAADTRALSASPASSFCKSISITTIVGAAGRRDRFVVGALDGDQRFLERLRLSRPTWCSCEPCRPCRWRCARR